MKLQSELQRVSEALNELEQRKKYKRQLCFCLIALATLYLIVFLGACSHKSIEPEWAPHTYLLNHEGECSFVDGEGHEISCMSPELDGMFMAPLSDLMAVKKKIQRCEAWKDE